MLFEVKNKEGKVLYATDRYDSQREAAQAILAQVRDAGWCGAVVLERRQQAHVFSETLWPHQVAKRLQALKDQS